VRYLSACFIGEGPTDRCLARVGMRAAEWILTREGRDQVEIGTPEIVRISDRRLEAITSAAKEAIKFHDLLLLHADGKGDPDRAFRERVHPVFESLRVKSDSVQKGFVGVVPVHETEAWLLADGEALRVVFGTRRTAKDLGLPTVPAEVESLPDPKNALREAQRRALDGRGRSRRNLDLPYELIAETVDLAALRRLSAFRRFEADLREALAALGLLAGQLG
jgi:hypothetical protein